MEVIKGVPDLKILLKEKRNKNLKIGFVPTMGALHEGHLELIKSCNRNCDLTVCSIFVNPIQFNSSEDFDKYPRNIQSDLVQLEKYGCHVVFLPETDDMYQKDRIINLNFGYLEKIMEGKFRPGHFKGVGLVVLKLFNMVQPNYAYFGKKDLQQYILIKRLTQELNLDINIVGVETVRNNKGLALSSRNERLTEKERSDALIFYHSLCRAKDNFLGGVPIEDIKNDVLETFRKSGSAQLEYFEIVHSDTLKPVKNKAAKNNVSLCIAGYIGKVRLIDNISIN